jgi:hypothetical protein
MPEAFIGSCKAALNNLISSEDIQNADDAFTAFSEGIMNFHAHYCCDDHSSTWCRHNKVRKSIILAQ